MRKIYLITLLLLTIPFILWNCSGEKKHSGAESDLFPKNGIEGNWRPVDTVRTFVGQDLFKLINGGAEIYHEYGFVRVSTLEYANDNGKNIIVELYEMTDPAAAYGACSFKTGRKGEMLKIGNDARLESYFLNFWKDKYLLTIVGFDSEEETRQGLVAIAKVIEGRIADGAQYPLLTDFLPPAGLDRWSINYIKGNMALMNNYSFGSGNIFGVKEGIIGQYDSYRQFIFAYENEEVRQRWMKQAATDLSHNTFYKNFKSLDKQVSADTMYENGFSVIDDSDRLIYVRPYRNLILIVLGEAGVTPAAIIDKTISYIETKVH